MINWKHIGEDALSVAIGGGILVGGFFLAEKILRKLGIALSYNGLSPDEVKMVYGEMEKQCQILSRSQGGTEESGFRRGIYVCPGPLYYYRYDWTNGKTNLKIYPLIGSQPFGGWIEEWKTDADYLNQTGSLVYPQMEETNA